jgi:sugar lactone lactonase YvrE
MKIRLYFLGILLTLFSGALLAQQSAGYSINTVAGGHVLGDNGPATEALLFSQEKIITDASGVMYIADTGWHRIRRVDASGRIETIAGTGVAGFSGDGQAATAAQLKSPIGLALYKGDLYVADSGNNRIRRISPATSAGIISTAAGDTSATRLSGPRGLAFDASGNLYITDWTSGGRLVRLTAQGQLQAVLDGLPNPGGIAMDPDGNILVAVTNAHVILRVTPGGDYAIAAGSGNPGFGGDRGPADGSGARLYYPSDVALDRLGAIYIADTGNGRIRKVMRQGNQDLIFTEAGGGWIPPFGGEYSTEDPLKSILSAPRGVWVDAAGAVYVSDTGYSLVRKLEAGTLKIFAGASRSRGDGGAATSASLYLPRGVAVAADGNLLIADTSNNKIRKVWPDGRITTLAGTGLTAGDIRDGARAEVALL